MVGNNSCGVHSVMAGKTDQNIDELEILTYDGLRMRVGQTSQPDQLRRDLDAMKEQLRRVQEQMKKQEAIIQKQQAVIDKLVDALGTADGAVLTDEEGRLQWLIGAWRPGRLRDALPAAPEGWALRTAASLESRSSR